MEEVGITVVLLQKDLSGSKFSAPNANHLWASSSPESKGNTCFSFPAGVNFGGQ